MCGESWHAIKGSLAHRPSSQGWAPGVLPLCVCMCMCVCVCVCVCVESRWLPPRGDSGNTVYTVAKASTVLLNVWSSPVLENSFTCLKLATCGQVFFFARE